MAGDPKVPDENFPTHVIIEFLDCLSMVVESFGNKSFQSCRQEYFRYPPFQFEVSKTQYSCIHWKLLMYLIHFSPFLSCRNILRPIGHLSSWLSSSLLEVKTGSSSDVSSLEDSCFRHLLALILSFSSILFYLQYSFYFSRYFIILLLPLVLCIYSFVLFEVESGSFIKIDWTSARTITADYHYHHQKLMVVMELMLLLLTLTNYVVFAWDEKGICGFH